MNFAFSPLIVFLCGYNFLMRFDSSLAYPEYSPGEVSPERLEISIGSNANITCRMNLTTFDGSNSSSLYFSESDTKKRVPQSDITIINASTIVYTLRNAMEQDRRYICMSDDKGIAEAHVIAGTPPTEVDEFKCRAYDYKYMVCKFTIPHNTLVVNYNLTFYWASPYLNKTKLPNGTIFYEIKYPDSYKKYIHNCELEKLDDGKYGICNITVENINQSIYQPHYEFYNFTLTGRNSLGNKIQSFGINNFESVIPPRPNFTLSEKSNDSVKFWWNMETRRFYKRRDLKFEVLLRPENFDWMECNYSVHGAKNGWHLNVENLPYAFYNYNLSIRVRVRSSKDDEDLWSETGKIEFQTSSCLPDAPPKTDVSSFDLIDTTESRVRLYWEQRPFYRKNGANFHYNISQVHIDGIPVEMIAIHIDPTSAIFPWDREHKYEFEIHSYNDEGRSQHASRIVVPAMESKRLTDYTPDWIRSMCESNRTFTLSWNPPANQSNLVDYTVFWCHSNPVLSNECNDTINFKHISKNITQYTTEFQQREHPFIFAVSANYIHFTTGLHWSMCTAKVSIDLVEMVPELKVISSRKISVQWNLGHFCPSILEGYNLTICPVEDVQNAHCLYSATTFRIEKNAKSHLITGLTPYTAYKIEMYMYSKMKRGKPSAPKILITHEEAPSQPRDLKYYNITGHSVWLSWSPPLEMNGILRSYTIVYCTEDVKQLCQSVMVVSEHSFKLENLNNYTKYKVYVLANTTEISQPSEKVHFKTLVGIPSKPQYLTTIDKNLTILQWTQADMLSERVDFYEVSIQLLYQDRKIEEDIFGVINATSCAITIPTCVNKDHKRLLFVRAVTAASRLNEADPEFVKNIHIDDSPKAVYFTEHSTLRCLNTELSEREQLAQWKHFHDSNKYIFYKSDWQNCITYGCAAPKEWFMLFLYLAVIVVLISCILICRIIYKTYKNMSDIQARLPPGLDYTLKDKIGERSSSNDRDDELYIRSKEMTNEHKRLLTMDSGYLGESLDVSAIGVSTPPISIGLSSSGYDGSDPSVNYFQADDFNTKNQLSSPNDDAYLIMHAPKYSETLQMQRPISTSIYVKPSKLCNLSEDLVTTSLAGGIAINPCSMSTVSSSGYVETRGSQKPVNSASFVSYTTAEALNLKAPPPPSGYVTPKELLALGQHSFS